MNRDYRIAFHQINQTASFVQQIQIIKSFKYLSESNAMIFRKKKEIPNNH